MDESECRQRISLCDRSKGTVDGVVDVLSFDTDQILLDTTQGMLTIKGEELHVGKICLEKGEVDFAGKVQLMQYTENGEYRKRKKGSLLKRLFQ